jgi:uncharacterized protein YgbK (DUF1537 family)
VASQVEQGVPAFSLPQELASGSELSPASRRQLEDQVIAACTSTTRVVIHVGLSPLKRVAVAESLALHLVSVARAVLHGLPIGHVFAEGGATAVALARQMGWSRLRVTAALAPGVVTLSPQDGSSMLFTMKPGTYLWPQTLARLPLR